jgi:hypothetical protein
MKRKYDYVKKIPAGTVCVEDDEDNAAVNPDALTAFAEEKVKRYDDGADAREDMTREEMEDEEDLRIHNERKNEPSYPLSELLKEYGLE